LQSIFDENKSPKQEQKEKHFKSISSPSPGMNGEEKKSKSFCIQSHQRRLRQRKKNQHDEKL
jgi:hypothetical protein